MGSQIRNRYAGSQRCQVFAGCRKVNLACTLIVIVNKIVSKCLLFYSFKVCCLETSRKINLPVILLNSNSAVRFHGCVIGVASLNNDSEWLLCLSQVVNCATSKFRLCCRNPEALSASTVRCSSSRSCRKYASSRRLKRAQATKSTISAVNSASSIVSRGV